MRQELNSEFDKQAVLDLLRTDFQQCFEQMRHYDRIFLQFVAGVFSFNTAILVILFKLFQNSTNKFLFLDFKQVWLIILIMALFVGVFSLIFLSRNRLYYVRVTRFVNEVRNHYLSIQPLNITNKAKLYVDYKHPKTFSLFSTQVILVYILSIFNAFYLFMFVFILTKNFCSSVILSFVLLIIQVVVVLIFLWKSDKFCNK